MDKINWGIIGCGDVTEVKSGPAFNKVPNSALIAVMRRDAAKAADYALRHKVPKWYSDADKLINDTEVNAVYVATPPDTHEQYTLQAIAAGKHVYVEKPMALTSASAQKMTEAAVAAGVKLCVAHYRREQPLFKKIKDLLQQNAIGVVKLVELRLHKTMYTPQQLKNNDNGWRVNPAVSGGGLFYDLAPHQLDIMRYLFGEVKTVNGISINQSAQYQGDDLVTGTMLFKSGVVFTGNWCFSAFDKADECIITGSKGNIKFSMFNYTPIELCIDGNTTLFPFDKLQHVQQPLITQVVQYFLGNADNPSSGQDGIAVMKLIEGFAE
jgi:predicted dehydrogenase